MPTLGKTTLAKTGFVEPSLLRVQDCSGGIDLRRSPSLLKANRARRLRNWSLENPGELTMVPGWATYSTSSLGTGRPQGAQRVYLADAVFTLASWDGDVYQVSDAGAWGSAVLSGLSDTHEHHFPYDRDMVAVFDGANVPNKSTDGSTWTQLGIDAPASAPTAALVAGGSLTSGSTYEFSYSGLDDADLDHDGNESDVVQKATTAGNQTVRLTLTKHPDSQVDTLVVYARDVTAGEAVRRKVGTVANPAGASTTYDVTSNTWSEGAEAPSDHDVAVAMRFGVVWKNRWWGVDATVGNRLRFSQIFDGQSWPTLFFIDIPFERGDSIAAIVPSGDTLVVFGYASRPYLIIGQTSLDFEVRPSAAAEAGALGPRAVATVEQGIIHAAAEGVYIFDGASDRLLSYDIDPGWRDYVTGASASVLEKTPVVYHHLRKELRIAVSRLFPYGTAGEWVLDLNRTRLQETPAWTSTDRTLGGYISWDGNESTVGNRGRLFSWDDDDGTLYEEATGTDADGEDLVADYEGPSFVGNLSVTRFLQLFGEFEPNPGSFGFEIVVDDVTVSTPTIPIGENLDVYGTGTYGTATYAGAGRKTFVADLPLEAEGLSIAVRASYRGQAAFRWFGYALSLVSEAQPRGL